MRKSATKGTSAAGVPKVRHSRIRKRRGWLNQAGWYEIATDPITTSTRQAAALQPALVAPQPMLRGDAFGEDIETGQPIVYSPHELYAQDRITAPNVTIVGDVGVAKTSALMTQYCLRPLARGASVALFDRKNLQGAGEYHRAAAIAPSARIRFSRVGGAIVNLLDEQIAVSSDGDDARVGQDDLLRMVAVAAYKPLDPYETWALGAAHKTALTRAKKLGRSAILADVVEALFNPEHGMLPHPALRQVVSREDVQRWGLPLALALQEFISGHLSGLINGETRGEDGGKLDLTAPFLLIDTSSLPEESPALGIVMAVIATYLTSVWANRPGVKYIGIEEGYHTANLPEVARIFRSIVKRGRGTGTSVISVFHHLSDVPPHSDASSLIRESGIVHIYRQDKYEEARQAVEMFNLPRHIMGDLLGLGVGRCILKIGSEPARMVQHLRSETERRVTDNDAAMQGETIDTSWMEDHLPGSVDIVDPHAELGYDPDDDPTYGGHGFDEEARTVVRR